MNIIAAINMSVREKYERNPFLLWVSPKKATNLKSVKTVTISADNKKANTKYKDLAKVLFEKITLL